MQVGNWEKMEIVDLKRDLSRIAKPPWLVSYIQATHHSLSIFPLSNQIEDFSLAVKGKLKTKKEAQGE